jgi:hypothetical protein
MYNSFFNSQEHNQHKLPVTLKMSKIKMKQKLTIKSPCSPDSLRIERYKLTPTLLPRPNNSLTRETKAIEKPNPSNNLFSETLNYYIQNRGLTNLAPGEVINHFKIENGSDHLYSKPKSIDKIKNKLRSKTPLKYPIFREYSFSDLEKAEEELFRTTKKKIRPLVKFKEKNPKDFEVIGNTLSFHPKDFIFKPKQKLKAFKIRNKYTVIQEVRLKSPVVLANSYESLKNPSKKI